MKQTLALSLSVIALLLVNFTGKALAQTQDNTAAADKRRVEILISPQIPVSLNLANATDLSGQTHLTYSINNSVRGQLSRLLLVAFIVSPSGEIKGGQGWIANIEETSDVSGLRYIALKNSVSPDDHITLTVWQAEGRAGSFEIPASDLVTAVKTRSYRAATTNPILEARFVKAHAQVADRCLAANDLAKQTCGCGGVQSFTCNPQTGEFSYTCFPKNGCDKAPGDGGGKQPIQP